MRADAAIRIPLIGGAVMDGTVHLVQRETDGWVRVGGETRGARRGTFTLATNGREVRGSVQFPREHLAYEIAPQADGSTLILEKSLGAIVCDPLPRYPDEALRALPAGPQQAPPILNSRPGAVCQLYLDFDGETVTDPAWNGGNTIVAAAPNVTNAQITTIFNRVTEDWWPFDINVTTDVAKYNGAPVKKRMRCIITPTDTAAPGSGGVAYLFSFNQAGGSFSNTIPCWVFNGGVVGIAEAISHELGHTMGLYHDGREVPGTGHEEYFLGHGTGATSWCPIMGAGYYVNVVQWSKGEYQYANNQEDDLAIISGATNSFGYFPDDAGDTRGAAAALTVNVANGAVNQVGLIARTGDVDFYSFATMGGNATITATPAADSPNLDIALTIFDSNGVQLAANNPAGALNASATVTNLAAGGYFVRIMNSGAGANPPIDGYTNYGSLGAYTLGGTVQNATLLPIITSPGAAAGLRNLPFSYQITAANAPTSFTCVGALPPGVTFTPGTGLIAGTPTVSGSYPVTIGANNSAGSSTKPLTITITSGTVELPEALDATAYGWTTGGNAEWSGQQDTTFDGVDAAESGAIGNNQSVYLETTVNGPGTVGFLWKVDSQPTSDTLRFLIDGVEQARISGNQNWAPANFDFTAGSHTLRWVYAKNGSVSTGADRGWVDTVSISLLPPPIITSAGTASGNIGTLFNYQIETASAATGYSFTGTLPPGLGLNTTTGLISGVPNQLGTFNSTITATNQAGSSAKDLAISISPHVISLSEAVDAPPALTFTSTGSVPWSGQALVTHDSVDAARSGTIGDSQQSEMQCDVFGPVVIRFQWKVSSENQFDGLSFLIDDTEQARISGEVNWDERSFAVPAGQHTLRWRYAKDNGFGAGADAAWVDQFEFDSRPFINSPSIVATRVGADFNYQLTTVNPATTFGAGAMPPGLVFDAASGHISGIPTQAGAFTVDLAATNGSGDSTMALKIIVDPNLPGGDLFGSATALDGSWVHLASTNSTATNESGEPNHGGVPGGHSMWWKWTAPSTGAVTISTLGSDFDTTLAVYTGDTLPTLTLLVENNNAGKKAYSRVRFLADAGLTYYLAVDGASGATGNIVLNIAYKKGATYAGLVYSGADAKLAGIASIKITSAQNYTGALTMKGRRYVFRGRLDPNAAQVHQFNGAAPLSLSLTSDPTEGTDAVNGSIQAGGIDFAFTAIRAISKLDVPAAAAGSYTLLAERGVVTPGVPAGAGWASMNVTRAGKVRVTGLLGDGATLSASGALDLDGNLPLFATPYRSGGVFGGKLAFDLAANRPTFAGTAQWLKTAGFETSTVCTGGRYIRPARGTPLFSFTAGVVAFTGSDLVLPAAQENILVTPKNTISGLGPMPGFAMTLDLATGLFRGSFLVGTKKNGFSGAVFLEQNRGAGFFPGVAETGSVALHASP